jgi:hypothetical protein
VLGTTRLQVDIEVTSGRRATLQPRSSPKKSL